MTDWDHEQETRIAVPQDIEIPAGASPCLVAIYAPDTANLGRRHVLKTGVTTIGRDRDNDIVLESPNVSRRHARVEERGGTMVLFDQGSTNGTFVNSDTARITLHQLRRGDQIRVGDTILKYLAGSDVEAQYHETIFRFTITDGLTNVGNKKYLLQVLQKEVPRAMRHQRALSLLMLDIDHFKRINDTRGHLAGDIVLREVAAVLRQRLRPNDELARYGGEEFAVLMPETALDGAVRTAETLRALIEQHSVAVDTTPVRVTVSIGVAPFEPGMSVDDFVKAADARLYKAKHGGRNQVCSA